MCYLIKECIFFSIPELSKLTIFRYDRDIFSLRLLFDGHNRFWQNYIHSKNIFLEVCRKIFKMCRTLCGHFQCWRKGVCWKGWLGYPDCTTWMVTVTLPGMIWRTSYFQYGYYQAKSPTANDQTKIGNFPYFFPFFQGWRKEKTTKYTPLSLDQLDWS